MEILFRPAEARDQERACGLIYSSAPESFEYIFTYSARTAVDFLGYAFIEGGGFFGCQNQVVAELDGRAAGIGAFYSGREYRSLAQQTGEQITHFYGMDWGAKVIERSRQLTRIMPPPDQRTQYVANLGVAPELQGQGIGSALIKQQRGVAQNLGLEVYALDVSVSNPRAQSLYQRLGFKVIQENSFTGTGEPGEIPDSIRMAMPL